MDSTCQRLLPLATTGDGNCLLHAASLGESQNGLPPCREKAVEASVMCGISSYPSSQVEHDGSCQDLGEWENLALASYL
jgi:hypothetical protein